MAIVYYVCTIHPETGEITYEDFLDDEGNWTYNKEKSDGTIDLSDDTIWVYLKGYYNE